MRIVEEAARHRHHIGLALRDDRLGVFGLDDQADGARGNAGFLLHARGDRHVVAGLARVADIGGDAAGRDADEVEPFAFKRLGNRHRVVGGQPALAPVAAGDARAERQAARHHRAHRARDRKRKAQAVLERAAILVGALVGDRRHEAVRQIAVRHVQFDLVEADAQAPLRGGNKCRAHAFHVRFGHFARRVPALAERDWRSGDGRPRIGVRFKRAAAVPWLLRRALAAGMGDLDAQLGGARAPHLRDHARQRGLVVVGIKPQAAMGYAAMALDMGRLHHHQRGAGIRQHAEMHQVPVVGAAVVARVLAHG